MLKFTIPVKPRTKKNHTNFVTLRNGKTILLPSKPYREFEKTVCTFIEGHFGNIEPIEEPVNLKCIFYKEKDYRSDLPGYIQAIADSLVKGGLLKDDNTKIITGIDGSRVFLDRDNPRIEVEITKIGETEMISGTKEEIETVDEALFKLTVLKHLRDEAKDNVKQILNETLDIADELYKDYKNDKKREN